MRKGATLGKIEKEIEKLTPQEKLRLAEILIHQFRKDKLSIKKGLDWNELYGLGKGLWKGEDAQEYVKHLREPYMNLSEELNRINTVVFKKTVNLED